MDTSTQVPGSLQALLSDLIDYAGLFPPAGLDMKAAVENYARYLAGSDAWVLGRFVLPVARFEEFEAAIGEIQFPESWCISALVGPNVEADLRAISQFNARNTQRVDVDTVEVKASSADDIHRISVLVPKPIVTYFEISPQSAEHLLPAIQDVDARAKIRTGGVTPDAFPSSEQVANFIVQCAEKELAFKATAGLHHPLRCVKPLTYAPDALKGTMHGFLNVFLAGALAQRGVQAGDLAAALEQNDAAKLYFDDQAVYWGRHVIGTEQIETARHNLAISFGSCSFEEPLADLRELKLL